MSAEDDSRRSVHKTESNRGRAMVARLAFLLLVALVAVSSLDSTNAVEVARPPIAGRSLAAAKRRRRRRVPRPAAVARTTSAPTSPPSLDYPRCDLDSEIMNTQPSRLDWFRLVEPDGALCEITEVRGPRGAAVIKREEDSCGVEACVRWCAYDSACKYAGYSTALRTCYKATGTQLTDDPDRVAAYVAEKWVVYAKLLSRNGDPGVPYYGGRCNSLVGAACERDPECAWNAGKRGYNDERLGDSSGGYCGRVRCARAKG